MIIQTAKGAFYIFLFILVVLPGTGYASLNNTTGERGASIYMLHGIRDLPESDSSDNSGAKKLKENIPALKLLSNFSVDTTLLPFADIETTVERIKKLSDELENVHENEKKKHIRFDLTYEYFLLYLYYQDQKYGKIYSDKTRENLEVPISDKEIFQYLLLAEHYLKTFIDLPDSKNTAKTSAGTVRYRKAVYGKSDDVSFYLRNKKKMYLNVNFLALMLACEKVAGQWPNNTINTMAVYDQKTYYWLNDLWRRYCLDIDKRKARKGKQGKHRKPVVIKTKIYTPSAKSLFMLYDLYLKYHFMWCALGPESEKGPQLDSITHILLRRLKQLQKDSHAGTIGFYDHYINEAKKDSGNTRFIPSLFFARRGYSIIQALNKDYSIQQTKLFQFYYSLFKNAAQNIKYNIPYRSRIYNEIILMGIETDNLHLMETVLYEYGLNAIRISQDTKYIGTDFEKSSRLTMAYLIANILDRKKRSGLDFDSDKYETMANSLCPDLISKYNHNWKYASIIHSALATFYSKQHSKFNESLSMYHARQAFLAPCQKLAITNGDNWKKFFKSPEYSSAVSYLDLFLYFQNKYPTNPNADIPKEFNAGKIINESLNR